MSDCSLLVDGISIRKQIFYLQVNPKSAGSLNFEKIVEGDNKTPASELPSSMLVGLKKQWKCHIGYLLTDKMWRRYPDIVSIVIFKLNCWIWSSSMVLNMWQSLGNNIYLKEFMLCVFRWFQILGSIFLACHTYVQPCIIFTCYKIAIPLKIWKILNHLIVSILNESIYMNGIHFKKMEALN